MRSKELASISIKKIIAIAIIFIAVLGISVLAGNASINNIKIRFSNNHEIAVLTSKTKVQDILDENHIVLEEDETVLPAIDAEITKGDTIVISKIGNEPTKKAEIEDVSVDAENILEQYRNIVEKIEVVIEEIPYETITKDVSNGSKSTTNKVLQYGKNGKKEVTYKVRYQDEVEIDREELSSKVIKKPVNKIVQVQTKVITSRSLSSSRVTGTSGKSGIYKVTAYCPCTKCCGKTDGITASGKKAQANHTVAAPSTFAFGTKVKINGVVYVVEDRGGAIQGNRIDIYMNTHQEALAWGVRYLELEVL